MAVVLERWQDRASSGVIVFLNSSFLIHKRLLPDGIKVPLLPLFGVVDLV